MYQNFPYQRRRRRCCISVHDNVSFEESLSSAGLLVYRFALAESVGGGGCLFRDQGSEDVHLIRIHETNHAFG